METLANTARHALERYGLTGAELTFLSAWDCVIFRLRAPMDAALRIYPARSQLADLETEVLLLQALQSAPELCAPCPLPAADGTLIQTLEEVTGGAPRYCVLLRWLQGRHFDRGLSPRKLHRLGRAVAGLHRVSAGLTVSRQIQSTRSAFSVQASDWQRITPAWTERLPRDGVRTLTAALERAQQEIALLPRTGDTYGLIHSDLHQGNYLFEGDHVALLDFSDCGWGHYAYDIASALAWLRHPWLGNFDHGARVPALEAAFLAGYKEVRALPSGLEGALTTFTAARLLSVLRWVLVDWPSPTACGRWGPGFVDKALACLRGDLTS